MKGIATMKALTAGILRKTLGSLTYHKRLPSEFGSGRLLVSPRADMRVLYPGFERAAFDLMLVSRLYVKQGACVWDIGSNLGLFSACAAYKAGPRGMVFSLEADPRYAALQMRSAATLTTAYAPIEVLCGAAADETSLLRFAVSRQGHARSHLAEVEGQRSDETESVQQVLSVTLDFLLQHWPKPDIIKIDVEGAEALVLQGADRMLREVAPILYIEVSDQNREAVTRRFHDHGYELFKLEADGSETPVDLCGLYCIARPAQKTVAKTERQRPLARADRPAAPCNAPALH